MDINKEIELLADRAKQASKILAMTPTVVKNKALNLMSDALVKERSFILSQNNIDMDNARKDGMSEAMLDRLLLTDDRIKDMALGLRQVALLSDPVGEFISGNVTTRGLTINKVRVPLGVIAIIYEARPNVTADAAGLCLKTGNTVILRGGSEAFFSNKAITDVLRSVSVGAGLPEDWLQFVCVTDRKAVDVLIKMDKYIDVVIPRGGAGLIKKVTQDSSVPVIETGIGVCHTFVDESADLTMATNIALNAKVSRPSVCNAMETMLVHENIAENFLPEVLERMFKAGVEIFGCERTKTIVPKVNLASEENWGKEYSDLKLSVKVVDDIEGAFEHIDKYSTHHSEAIVTSSYENSQLFLKRVDAATVYVNASTRFTDGFEFGFGAEIGISTQKLHARGPMGLPELTSYKYIVTGNGQIRK